MKIETFDAPFQMMQAPDGLQENEFEGYASVFYHPIDAWFPTIIERGAFRRTLEHRGKRIKVMWQHDEPIGLPKLLEEDHRGLHTRALISLTDTGRKALVLVRDGVIDRMSIGFDRVREEILKHDKNWRTEVEPLSLYSPEILEEITDNQDWHHIKELRLWELSLVTFPANEAAAITAVHCRNNAIRLLTEYFGDLNLYEEQASFTVQTLIFPKDKWDSLDDCKKWASDHDYKTDNVDPTDESWRLRQRDPDDFIRLRTICINPGKDTELDDCKVKAVGGPLKEGLALDLVKKIGLHISSSQAIEDAIAAFKSRLVAPDPPHPPSGADGTAALTAIAERVNRLQAARVRFARHKLSTTKTQ